MYAVLFFCTAPPPPSKHLLHLSLTTSSLCISGAAYLYVWDDGEEQNKRQQKTLFKNSVLFSMLWPMSVKLNYMVYHFPFVFLAFLLYMQISKGRQKVKEL